MIRNLPSGKWQADFAVTGLRRQRANFDTPEQAKDWLRIRRIEAESRVPVRLFTERDRLDATEAVEMLPKGVRLVDAAKFYCLHHVQKGQLLQTAWEEFLKDRQAAGLREASLAALRCSVLHHMIEKLPGRKLEEITVAALRELLVDGRVGPVARNNRRRGWVTFFEFCIKSGWLLENPAKAITKARTDDEEPEIFTPIEAHAWLNHIAQHRPELLVFYGAGFFGGIRTAELERLTWADFREEITIPARIAKKRSTRIIPILPPLRNILDHCPRGAADELIAPVKTKARLAWTTKQGDLDDAKLPAWKSNVMRHSFISYRVAAIQDVGKVAFEAGTSPTMIFKHYRSLVKPADAELYFGFRLQ